MFEGQSLGVRNDAGVDILCGSQVLFTQVKPAYIETDKTDGWGKTTRLCEHDRYVVKEQKSTLKGVVYYNESFTAFKVKFNGTMLGSGRREEDLHVLLRMAQRGSNSLVVEK